MLGSFKLSTIHLTYKYFTGRTALNHLYIKALKYADYPVPLEAPGHPFYENMTSTTLTFIAHRGGDGGYENTSVAFQAAADSGVQYVETDIRCTSDSVPVHFHGDSVTKGIIGAVTFAELNTPRIHKALGIDEGEGVYIPILEDTLTEFPNLRFFLDLKSDATPIPTGYYAHPCRG